MKICNAKIEETALAAVWVTDSVDRCQVGITSWYHVKHGIGLMVIGPSNGGIQSR